MRLAPQPLSTLMFIVHTITPSPAGPKRSLVSTLALTASRPSSHDNVCLHRGEPLIGFFLLVEYFDLCRLEGSHVTAAAGAVLAAAAPPPPMLADAAAATVLAGVAPPAVLADAAAAAVLASATPPPVLTEVAATTIFAIAAPPPVLADATATAVLAVAALPPVLADAFAAAVLARCAPPPVRTGHGVGHARALLARLSRRRREDNDGTKSEAGKTATDRQRNAPAEGLSCHSIPSVTSRIHVLAPAINSTLAWPRRCISPK